MSVLRLMRRGMKTKVTQPDYAGLTNVIFHGRWEGLVSNTNNDYGQVNDINQILQWKSVAPHATGVVFTNNNVNAPLLQSDGIEILGTGCLRHSTVATFEPLSYRANINDLKWTVH